MAAIILAALLVAVFGVLALVPAPDAPYPRAPAIDAPLVPAVPGTDVPRVGAPDVGLPDVGVPDVGVPDLSVPDVSVPDVSRDSGSGTGAPDPAPRQPQTYRRYINLHVHLWRLLFIWSLPWWPPAALVAAAALSRVRRPLPRASRWWITALDFAALASVAALAWAAAVTIPNSDGQPVTYEPVRSQTRQLDDGDKEIVITREERHRHLPIEIAMHWSLLALAASVLAGRSLAAVRVAPRRRDDVDDAVARA